MSIALCLIAVGAPYVGPARQARADAVINPDADGSTAVTPASNVTGSGDLAGLDLRLGFTLSTATPGTLEINANSNTNGVTALINVDDMNIANTFPGTRGELRIIGNGAPGSASVTGSGFISLFANSDSVLTLQGGGQLTNNGSAADSGNIGMVIGSFADFNPGQGDATVLVQGPGSILAVHGGGLDVGFTNPGGADSLTISGGGKVLSTQAADALTVFNNTSNSFKLIDGQVFVGENADGETDTVLITGQDSVFEFSSGFFLSHGNARVEVLNGGRIQQIEQSNLIDQFVGFGTNSNFFDSGDFGIAVSTPFQEGSLVVSGTDINGTPSTVSATRDVDIGLGQSFAGFDTNNNPIFNPASGHILVDNGAVLTTTRSINVSVKDDIGTGTLTVATAGTVTAQNVNVYDGGLLNGNGGTIIADVLVDGGTIAPGASPGSMTIDGNLTLLDGVLEIEIAGAGAGQFDNLLVTGDLVAPDGVNLQINFLGGFSPSAGDVFEFLNILGDSSVLSDPSMIHATFTGLDPGITLALDFASGGLSVQAVPEPATLSLLGAASLTLLLRRRPDN